MFLRQFAASLAARTASVGSFVTRPLLNNGNAVRLLATRPLLNNISNTALTLPRAAAAATRTTLLSSGSALPTPLLATATRSILSVDVHQPGSRMGSGPLSSPVSLAEVARAEEIALASFNRMVFQEVERGCLRPGARRNKRWARLQKRIPRANRKASKWRAHKRKLTALMNWIQYRQRRTMAK